MAYFTAISAVPLTIGQSRIIAGRAVTHVLGDPELPLDRERAYRRALVEQALEALTTEVRAPTVFAP